MATVDDVNSTLKNIVQNLSARITALKGWLTGIAPNGTV